MILTNTQKETVMSVLMMLFMVVGSGILLRGFVEPAQSPHKMTFLIAAIALLGLASVIGWKISRQKLSEE